MDLLIRPLRDDEIDAVVGLSLAAWDPVFRSFARILGPAVYGRLYPDWRTGQRAAVEGVCHDRATNTVWVAVLDDTVVGFVAYSLDAARETGEVQLLAVHPVWQGRGIGTALNALALGKMAEGGMTLAVAETGDDPAHAPARRSYEKAGYVGLPLVRYFKSLRGNAD
jgi:ribosomal protein S18 acetylase RimI-like enzyme